MLNKVLVVDDLPVVHSVFRLFLKEYGCKIVEARNGQEGIDKLAAEDGVDLVFLDINMPVKDGVGFMEDFRKNGKNGHPPVIVMSGESNEKMLARCLALGAKGFLRKPFNFKDLCRIVDETLAPGSALVGNRRKCGH